MKLKNETIEKSKKVPNSEALVKVCIPMGIP